MRLPDPLVRPGEPLKAEPVNLLGRAVGRLLKSRGGPGVTVHNGPNGQTWAATPGTAIQIRLTSSLSGGAYGWREVYGQSGGGYANGYRSGGPGDPAWEKNLTATLPVGSTTGLVVDADRDPATGELRFQMDVCS